MRHEIHPWFDHQLVAKIRESCREFGFDYLERDKEKTRAMTEAGIEDRGEGNLPWLFGPKIYPMPDNDLDELTGWMEEWLTDIGALNLSHESQMHFNAQIGRRSISLKYRLEGASFLAASESKNEDEPRWITVNWFSFDHHIASSATEEAICGGRQAFLAKHISNHPISKTLQSYEIADERTFSPDCVQIWNPILKEST